ncbi:ABC transporter ATP-binding protein [Hoeflea sp. CAU 1731]
MARGRGPHSREKPLERETIWPLLKRIFSENFRDYVGTYIFAIACLMLVAATTAFTAWITKDIVDEAFAKQRGEVVWWISGAVFLTFVVRGLAGYGQAVALAKVGNNIVARYQRRLFTHLMKMSVGYLSEVRSAQLAARVSQNAGGIRSVLNMTITSLARDLLTVIGLVAVMIYRDPVLFAGVVLVAPPLVLALRYIATRLRVIAREAVLVNSRVLGTMQESLQGIAVVKAFTMEKELGKNVDVLIRDSEARSNRIARLTERTGPLTETLAGLAIAGVLAYAAIRTIYGGVLPGDFFSFVTALLFAYEPAKRLARLQITMEGAMVNARMIYEILDEEPDQPDLSGDEVLEIQDAEIRFEDVSFSYGEASPVLHNVSFVAEGGKMTALVGPSGAGKSTIMSLLPRFYDADGGRILIDGQDVSKITKDSLRHAIAYVSQQPYLFEGTIRDNIRYGRPEATNEEIEQAARLAYAHDFILEQPHGYDTPVGEAGMSLSGGQRQRISIARALIRNAPILLLDEATSALDTESEVLVQKALEQAMSGRTVLVIAHRLSTVAHADKIVVLLEGKVVEQGDHRSLTAMKDGLYARFLKMQDVGKRHEEKELQLLDGAEPSKEDPAQ